MNRSTKELEAEIEWLNQEADGQGTIIQSQGAEIERLRAALRAMAEAPYEQPIGVWQYIIRAALEHKP